MMVRGLLFVNKVAPPPRIKSLAPLLSKSASIVVAPLEVKSSLIIVPEIGTVPLK